MVIEEPKGSESIDDENKVEKFSKKPDPLISAFKQLSSLRREETIWIYSQGLIEKIFRIDRLIP